MAGNDQNYFEGVEKLVEIWFTRKDKLVENCDLREIPRQDWESLLKIVHCEIISFAKNEHVDAYVLSESSMFVAQRRLILKTCGSTTPLKCLKPLLLLVYQLTQFDHVDNIFYSRKNFKRPDLQVSPHQHFEQEVELLDSLFADRGGSAYCLGAVNRSCWYLYTLNPLSQAKAAKKDADQTLEILMTNLDTSVMSIFTRLESSSAAQATRKAGIDKLIPSMVIDDFLFEPCGYSMNGISSNGSYMTIHITPEPEFSYVSFETNLAQSSYKDVIQRVLHTFKPGHFVVTLFANEDSVAGGGSSLEMEKMSSVDGWKRQDLQYCKLKDYDLTYAFYSKFPS